MTTEQFDALLARRDELRHDHECACLILEEEGPTYSIGNRKRCAAVYDQLVVVEAQISAIVAEERAAEERAAQV